MLVNIIAVVKNFIDRWSAQIATIVSQYTFTDRIIITVEQIAIILMKYAIILGAITLATETCSILAAFATEFLAQRVERDSREFFFSELLSKKSTRVSSGDGSQRFSTNLDYSYTGSDNTLVH